MSAGGFEAKNLELDSVDGFMSVILPHIRKRVGTRGAGCGRVDNGGKTASTTPRQLGFSATWFAWAPFVIATNISASLEVSSARP